MRGTLYRFRGALLALALFGSVAGAARASGFPGLPTGCSQVAPTSDFGDVPLGQTRQFPGAALTAGPYALTIANVQFVGPDASAFAYPGLIGRIIPANSVLPIVSLFTPSHLGPHYATAVVTLTGVAGTIPFSFTDCRPRTGNGTLPAGPPNDSLLQIVDGGGQATLTPGHCVTLDLMVRFTGETQYFDLTQTANTSFTTDPQHGHFTSENVWCATAADVGHDITIYGSYRDPNSGISTTATVIVHVRAASG